MRYIKEGNAFLNLQNIPSNKQTKNPKQPLLTLSTTGKGVLYDMAVVLNIVCY